MNKPLSHYSPEDAIKALMLVFPDAEPAVVVEPENEDDEPLDDE